MAGDWIRCGNLWDDPRVQRLCDETGKIETTVAGALYWLWTAADQHSDDGFLRGMSLASLDRKCIVAGLGAALVPWDNAYSATLPEHGRAQGCVGRRGGRHSAGGKRQRFAAGYTGQHVAAHGCCAGHQDRAQVGDIT
jgi:hypothetical protein